MRNPLIGTYVSRCKALLLLSGMAVMLIAGGPAAQAKTIAFDESFPREYVRGSGKDITFSVDKNVPEGSYAVARVWHETERKMLTYFRHEITGPDWKIESEMLDRIPNGMTRLFVYLHRPNRQLIHDKRHLRIRGDAPVVVVPDPDEQPIPDGQIASKALFPAGTIKTYETYSGVDIPFTLNGKMENGAFVRVRAWNNGLKRMADDVFEYDIKPGDPLVIESKMLDRLPEGHTKILLFYFDPGASKGRVNGTWVKIVRGDNPPPDEEPGNEEPTDEEPSGGDFATAAEFDGRLPSSYTTGSGATIPFVVNGSLAEGAFVRIRSWSNENRDMVIPFRHEMNQGPWQIASSQLDKLPEGLNLLHLYLFQEDGSYVHKKGWVTVLGGNSDQGPPIGDGGSDGGDGGDGGSDGGDGGSDGGDGDGGGSDGGSGGGGSDGGGGDDPGDGPNPGEWPSDGVRKPNGFLAINVDEPHYWSRSWTFTDVMDQATWRENVGAFLAFTDAGGRYPKGQYTVVPSNAASVNVGNKLTITPNPGFENGDFKVYLPGFAPGEQYAGQQFHPLYLERLKPFKTIRFMQWQQTNNVNEAAGKWSNRIKPEDRRVDDKLAARVPIEHMVDLVNELEADPWFCMPHTADSDYLRNFARLVKGRLHGGATVYVEFSNELWNTVFGQSKLVYSQQADEWYFDVWAAKIKMTRDIWREEFGADADRIVMVLASKETSPWMTEQLVKELTDGGQRHFDAIATAAYFGNAARSIDEVFEDIRGKKRDRRLAQGKIASDYGVPYITYEAGPHDLANDQDWHDSDRMYDAMIENMKVFEEAGGQMYNAFLFVGPNNNWGYWGHLEYQDVPLEDAPKFKALLEYVDSNERLQLSNFD